MSNIFPVMVAPRWPRLFTPAVAVATNIALLGTAGAQPLSSGSGALPAPIYYPVSLRTWHSATNLLLGKDAMLPGGPARVTDLPPRAPPRLEQTWTQMDRLLGLDTMPPGGPARIVDLPPARYARPRLEQTWISGPLLLGQDAMPPGGAATADDLAPARFMPFRLEQTWTHGPLLLGQDAMPPGLPARADAPVPAALMRYRLPQTWSTAPLLLGQDAMLPGGASTIDDPVRGAIRALQSWQQNLLQTTLGTLPMPFATYDWPLPGRAPYGAAFRSWATPAPGLLGQDVFPPGLPNTLDDPAPFWTARYRMLQSWEMNFFVAPVGVPFVNYDWPLPQRAPLMVLTWLQSPRLLGQDVMLPGGAATIDDPPPVRFVPYRVQQTWTQANYLLGKDTMLPGLPSTLDDPVPTAPPRLQQTWTQVLLQTTLSVAPMPPANYDWPLPQRAPLLVKTWSVSPLLLGQDAMPPGGASTLDDPPPRGPARVLQSWQQNLLQTTLGVLPMPFAIYDTSLPMRSRDPVRSWTQAPIILGRDTFPPGLPKRFDDPLPTRAPLLVKSWSQLPLSFSPPPIALMATDRLFIEYKEGHVRISYSDGSARAAFEEGTILVALLT